MATAEELLTTVGNEENYIVIDSDLRTMTFPASVKNIGVENDKDVHKLNFMMPRYFGEYDLSTFNIRINYLNAQGDGDMYVVTDPTVEEDAIYFTWLVGRHACLYRGAVTFIVCLKLADGEGDVAQEFNTTLASLQVLPGLETEPTILENDYDIIEQLLLTVQDTNSKIKAVLDSGMTAEELGNIAKEQKTLKSRMDEFASLPDGSTAGDAELTDIRVGEDGTTYKSAGEAVRTQIANVKEDLSYINTAIEGHDKKILTISPNLYNKKAPALRPGYFATSSGWASADGDARLGTTHPLYLKKGTTYRWPVYSSIYGTNVDKAYRVRIPGDGEIIDISNVGTVADGFCIVTINYTGWYVFDINILEKDTFMFCLNDEYPDYYFDYGVARISSDYPNVFLTFDGDGTIKHLSSAYLSPNLFNKNSDLIQTSRYCGGWSWASADGDARLGTTHPLYLKKGTTYRWPSSLNVYGNNDPYLWRIRSESDLTLISRKQGTYSSDNSYLTWTCDEEGFWIVNMNITAKSSFMFCEASKYPSDYAEFAVYYASDNIDYSKITTLTYLPLSGKILVCDGDSIAAATPDDPESKGGWFGRLRDGQKIVGANYAIGGGTITYLSDSRHCISRSIDTIHNNFPSLDYLILEGGTNDADLIGRWSGNTPPANFGTWSENDFGGTYDDTTFCGAVESLFYKALNYWPHAHIGFIIAMEMGTNQASLTNRKKYFDEIVKIAEKWHIPVLNLWDKSGVDARLTAFYDSNMSIAENVAAHKFYRDGQHPSSYGYNKMQPMIEAWVKGL